MASCPPVLLSPLELEDEDLASFSMLQHCADDARPFNDRRANFHSLSVCHGERGKLNGALDISPKRRNSDNLPFRYAELLPSCLDNCMNHVLLPSISGLSKVVNYITACRQCQFLLQAKPSKTFQKGVVCSPFRVESLGGDFGCEKEITTREVIRNLQSKI